MARRNAGYPVERKRHRAMEQQHAETTRTLCGRNLWTPFLKLGDPTIERGCLGSPDCDRCNDIYDRDSDNVSGCAIRVPKTGGMYLTPERHEAIRHERAMAAIARERGARPYPNLTAREDDHEG